MPDISGARTDVLTLDNTKDSHVKQAKKEQAILYANEIVDTHLGGITDADRQKRIETLLAAHILSVGLDKEEGSLDAGGSKASFLIEGGIGLDASGFGQMAKILDDTGTLEDLDSASQGDESRSKANATLLGGGGG